MPHHQLVPVITQVVLPSKSLIADITSVRPLVGVRPLVNEEIVGLGEATLTEATDELFFRTTRDAIHASQLTAEVVGQMRVLRLKRT